VTKLNLNTLWQKLLNPNEERNRIVKVSIVYKLFKFIQELFAWIFARSYRKIILSLICSYISILCISWLEIKIQNSTDTVTIFSIIKVDNIEAFSILSIALLYIFDTGERRQKTIYEASQVIDSAAAANVETSYARIKALEDLNHYGVSLKGLDVPEADLENINLQGAKLQEADFKGAKLPRANLQGAKLYKTELQQANLYKAQLQGANLRAAKLQQANLQGANLRVTQMQEAKLQGADLQDANLQDADLQDADLRDADLQDANLQGANLQGAKVKNALFIDAEGLFAEDKVELKKQGAIFRGTSG